MSSGSSFCIFGRALLDLVDDAHRRCVGPLGRQDVDRAAAVDQRIAGRDVGRVFDRADVAQVDTLLAVPCEWECRQVRRMSVTIAFVGTTG